MQIIFAFLLLALLSGCGAPDPRPDVDSLEIRLSGWTGVDIALNRQGQGHFAISESHPGDNSGSFSVTPRQFQHIRERLEPYRREAVTTTEDSAREFIHRRCPDGVPFVTDAGAVYIRWTGPGSDQHYLADLGCDAERKATRNRELLNIIESLPVPLDR